MKGVGKIFTNLWHAGRRSLGVLVRGIMFFLAVCPDVSAYLGGVGYQQSMPPYLPAAPWGGHAAPPLFTYQQPAYGAYGYHAVYDAVHPSPYSQGGFQAGDGASSSARRDKQPHACRIKNCSTLGGFKRCLATKSSPYAAYVRQPYKAETQRANDAFQEFIHRRPKCYRAFCLGMCTEVSQRIQNARPPRVRPETATTFRESRKAAALLTAYHRRKRWAYANRVCQQDSLEGRQLRMLCSACDEVLEGSRPVVAPCQVQILGVGDDGKLKLKRISKEKVEEIREDDMQDDYTRKTSGESAPVSDELPPMETASAPPVRFLENTQPQRAVGTAPF